MADIDIDRFGDHKSRDEEPMGENIPHTPGGGESTWEPEHEQETSFGGESQRTRLVIEDVERYIKNYPKNTSFLRKGILTCLKSKIGNSILWG